MSVLQSNCDCRLKHIFEPCGQNGRVYIDSLVTKKQHWITLVCLIWLLPCDSLIKSRLQLCKHREKLYEIMLIRSHGTVNTIYFLKQFRYPEPLHCKVNARLTDSFYNMAYLVKRSRAKRNVLCANWWHKSNDNVETLRLRNAVQ